MRKRKPMDKEQARERRNRLLETAAAAELSITEGVREMRAIAGMTQEEFARHRGVSARVIKGIELGQANPTVATLNQIGQFFGLEVGFVPIRRATALVQAEPASQPTPADSIHPPSSTVTGKFKMPSQEQIQKLAYTMLENAFREAFEKGFRIGMDDAAAMLEEADKPAVSGCDKEPQDTNAYKKGKAGRS